MLSKEVQEKLTGIIESEVEKTIRGKYNDIQTLAKLWVRWNIKEVTTVEVVNRISKIFPVETEKEWKEHLKSEKDNKPLKALLV